MQKAQLLLAEPGQKQRTAHAPAHRTIKGTGGPRGPSPGPRPALTPIKSKLATAGSERGSLLLVFSPSEAGAPVKPPLNLLSGLSSISIGEQGQEPGRGGVGEAGWVTFL